MADDGAGIDVELLKARILQKGLKTQEELSLMDEKDSGTNHAAGFSTASSVTDLSAEAWAWTLYGPT